MRTRVALALRSSSSWILACDGRHCPLSHPPRAVAQARPSQCACAFSQPPDDCIHIFIVAPARPDGSNSGSSR
eukprot:6191392-Pleurochrysis_carterae.AAC.1